MCCRVSNVTKALVSLNANPWQSSWCTYFPVLELLWLQQYNALGCPLSKVFFVSSALVSSPTTPNSMPTSTLLSAMSTLTLITLRWTPFARVVISTLVLRNVISAPCTPLPSIYIPWLNFWTTFPSLWWLPSKLTMTDICIQSILSAAGVPGYYIRHSFCIGTADLVEWVTKQKLECHLPDALPWWLLYSYPTGFSVSGQVCWLFL